MKLSKGTQNLLFGEHQFLIHPLFLARAWWKLYGFPWNWRLWVCFFVHDLGYWGKDDINGEVGRNHPELGAALASWLLDPRPRVDRHIWFIPATPWYDFCLYHSRWYAKQDNHPVSALAIADKYAFVLTPWWVFIPLARLSDGIKEYLRDAPALGEPTSSPRVWYKALQDKTSVWVNRTLGQQVNMPKDPEGIRKYYQSWEKPEIPHGA